MPARSERITIVPDVNGQAARISRFPFWWDRAGFIEKFKAREIDSGNPIDANSAWLLTAAEATVWDARCRAAFSLDAFAGNLNVQEEMLQLEHLLRQAAWVIVESYEWESGLD